MKKWTSLVFMLAFLSSSCAGCFLPTISFDIPSFMPVDSNTLPNRVDKAFKKAYPTATNRSVDSLTSPVSGEERFRITFIKDGELMETIYREDGKELRGSLRRLPLDEKMLEVSGDRDEPKDH